MTMVRSLFLAKVAYIMYIYYAKHVMMSRQYKIDPTSGICMPSAVCGDKETQILKNTKFCSLGGEQRVNGDSANGELNVRLR